MQRIRMLMTVAIGLLAISTATNRVSAAALPAELELDHAEFHCRIGQKIYVQVGVENAAKTLVATRTWKKPYDGLPKEARLDVYNENRSIGMRDGMFEDLFAPMDVHIYTYKKQVKRE